MRRAFKRIFPHKTRTKKETGEPLNDILNSLTGILPDSGKTQKQYRDERIKERYEITD